MYKNNGGLTDCWETDVQKFMEFIFGKTLTRGMIRTGIDLVNYYKDQIMIAGKTVIQSI